MSGDSEPPASKIRIVKWAKISDNPEPPAVNVQQMRLNTMETSAVPDKLEPSHWGAQVKPNAYIAKLMYYLC